MTAVDLLLWAVLPYVTIVILIAGTIWRYRYDQFGWTTRSSQLYESRLLRIGSPLFHFGILAHHRPGHPEALDRSHRGQRARVPHPGAPPPTRGRPSMRHTQRGTPT
jgi:hypothetical protein